MSMSCAFEWWSALPLESLGWFPTFVIASCVCFRFQWLIKWKAVYPISKTGLKTLWKNEEKRVTLRFISKVWSSGTHLRETRGNRPITSCSAVNHLTLKSNKRDESRINERKSYRESATYCSSAWIMMDVKGGYISIYPSAYFFYPINELIFTCSIWVKRFCCWVEIRLWQFVLFKGRLLGNIKFGQPRIGGIPRNK